MYLVHSDHLPYVSCRAERPRQNVTLPRLAAGIKSLWS